MEDCVFGAALSPFEAMNRSTVYSDDLSLKVEVDFDVFESPEPLPGPNAAFEFLSAEDSWFSNLKNVRSWLITCSA